MLSGITIICKQNLMLLNEKAKPKLHVSDQKEYCLWVSEVGAYKSVCQPEQQVEEVVFMTEKPGSGVRQGGRSPTATLQVTNHRLWQEETSELQRRPDTKKEKMRYNIGFCVCYHKMAAIYIFLANWWTNTGLPRGCNQRQCSWLVSHIWLKVCLAVI